ncbi:MAG: hypothetical protein AAFV54_07240 [Pseudomonadota bacterium]
MLPARILTVFIFAACAGTPSAQSPEALSAEQTASEPVETDASSSEWQDTDTGLLHVESGVTCPSFVGDFTFTGEVSFSGQGESKDVACNYIAEAGGAIRLHITRFARAVTTDAYLKGSLETVRDRYRQSADIPAPRTGEDREITTAAAALRTDAVSANRPGTPVDTALWIEQLGGWHIKVRATYETDRTSAVAEAVSTLFGSVRADLSDLTLY